VGRRGLGRGLSALIATGDSVGGLKFEELPISAIRPNSNQPRRSFPEAGIKELAASIREVGILQPLVVRSTADGFELIAGERRLRAAREAGLDRVPVLIRQAGETESVELALVENLQREDLNPLETAAAYQALMDGFGLSKEQLAHRLGKSRPSRSGPCSKTESSRKDTRGRFWVSRERSRWSSSPRESRQRGSPSEEPKN
jgi:ParB family chromosome partitioning protein